MTMYAPSDVKSINLPNGCKQQHHRGDAAQLVVDCGPCEAALSAHPSLGWAYQADSVALTPDERAQASRDDEKAQRAGVRRLAQWAAGGDAPAQPPAAVGLVEQVLRMTPEEKAALRVLLGTDTPAPAAAPAPAEAPPAPPAMKAAPAAAPPAPAAAAETKPAAPAMKATAPAAAPEAPAKRPPGRPRKVAEAPVPV